ncbi:MAG TPA: aquaporin Z [Burkholderiales bacterium]|nr:aquaporin Z [Burkholderiales bacterium]
MQRYIAEFVGTFVLVFASCGAAVIAGEVIGFVGVSFAFGLSLMAMIYAIGPISGCHINPAVTLGIILCKKMDAKYAPGYMLAQVLGAIAGAAVLMAIVQGAPGGYDAASAGFAANGYGEYSPGRYSLTAALITEIVLTFILVYTVLAATDLRAPVGFAGVAIGFVLTLVHLVGIPIDNTSVNPARSIGPALFVGGWALEQLWLFIVAPFVGATLAAIVYRTTHTPGEVIPVREAEQALKSEQAERLS